MHPDTRARLLAGLAEAAMADRAAPADPGYSPPPAERQPGPRARSSVRVWASAYFTGVASEDSPEPPARGGDTRRLAARYFPAGDEGEFDREFGPAADTTEIGAT